MFPLLSKVARNKQGWGRSVCLSVFACVGVCLWICVSVVCACVCGGSKYLRRIPKICINNGGMEFTCHLGLSYK